MEYQEYLHRSQQASQLVESGRLKEAVDALFQLILADISDIDKAALCVRLATVYDRMGNIEEALSYYDKGIGYEQVYCRYEVAEKKIGYLTSIGRSKDAVPIFEALIKQPYVSEAEKEQFRKSIQMLLGKSMQQWQ